MSSDQRGNYVHRFEELFRHSDRNLRSNKSAFLRIWDEKASIVNPDQIPADVITLNTTARLVDEETKEEMAYTLVFPEDADISLGKISILASIGTAMLGYKRGDSFEWDTPGGKRILRVKEILYQPEASGDEQ